MFSSIPPILGVVAPLRLSSFHKIFLDERREIGIFGDASGTSRP